MKTNKMIAAGLAATTIIALSLSSTYAMNGQGNGQGKGNGKGNGQGMHQGQGQGNGQGQGKNKENHNPADMIADIEKQDVSAIEIDLLEKQYEEEMMANELYMSFYEKYGVQTFKNIADSESQHMKAVKALLDRYEIETPTSYEHIQELYEELKAKGDLSLKNALEVGISIEIVDIDDIYKAILASDNDDIRVVLTNIGGASYNHMRGFVNALNNNDFTTDIDYSDYLTDADVTTKGGGLKVKLSQKLEAEGIELPKNASSKVIQEKCDEENTKNANGNKGNNKGQGKKSNQNSEIYNQYKN